jgi:hypothetical protein
MRKFKPIELIRDEDCLQHDNDETACTKKSECRWVPNQHVCESNEKAYKVKWGDKNCRFIDYSEDGEITAAIVYCGAPVTASYVLTYDKCKQPEIQQNMKCNVTGGKRCKDIDLSVLNLEEKFTLQVQECIDYDENATPQRNLQDDTNGLGLQNNTKNKSAKLLAAAGI